MAKFACDTDVILGIYKDFHDSFLNFWLFELLLSLWKQPQRGVPWDEYPWKVHKTPKNIYKDVHFLVRCRVKTYNFTKDEFFQWFFFKGFCWNKKLFSYVSYFPGSRKIVSRNSCQWLVLHAFDYIWLLWLCCLAIKTTDPVGIYLLIADKINISTRCEICSKLTIKTP